jgi:hypothetical protein
MEDLQETLNHLYDKLTRSRQGKKREMAAAH